MKVNKASKYPFINRDISWLGFNERVLQEAEDTTNPIIERFKFLGIFSNNADEFYRVRVASLERLSKLKQKLKSGLYENPDDILKEIQKITIKQKKRFEEAFKKVLIDARKHGIKALDETNCAKSQIEEIAVYFNEVVRTSLVPIILDDKRPFPELKDGSIYLAIKLSKSKQSKDFKYALIEIPSKTISRFKVLAERNNKKQIILLDDIIRLHLKDIFGMFDYPLIQAFCIKIIRDAELDLDEDDFSMSFVEQVTASIEGRKRALPTRFEYDKRMPTDLKDYLFKRLKLKESDNVIGGGRYHNFKDFMGFPKFPNKKLINTGLTPLKHKDISDRHILNSIEKKDILLNYPYQSFDVIIDLLREAAIDPNVKSIKINVYRLAKNSKIVNALINAVKNGKKVVVVLELKARFDEGNNIYWSNKLREEGVKVIFGIPGLKVHSKLILISRKVEGKLKHYAHIGTGNFHEGTAKVYTDTSLLTCDKKIALEVVKIFDFFNNNFIVKRYSNLIVSPTGTRRKFVKLINEEIKFAKEGKEAEIILKLNNLVDREMIKKFYQASKAGVKVRLIIRGTCSIVPGVKGLSENIQVKSIVDQFLEHSRILFFKNGGKDLFYISSSDWMTRNLDHRVEVSTPIFQEDLKEELKDLLELQWADNVKARSLDPDNYNLHNNPGSKPVRSQIKTYNYFKAQLKD